jgi:hypothetical protein
MSAGKVYIGTIVAPAMCLFAFLFLVSHAQRAFSQEHHAKMGIPVAVSASVPLYPLAAADGGIEGTVKFRAGTNGDGDRVASYTDPSGPDVLLRAALDNIETWRFKADGPMFFDVEFNYKILDEYVCDTDPNNPAVVLHLPTTVEITVKKVHPCPMVPMKPPFVTLAVNHNGESVPPPSKVVFTIHGHSIQVSLQQGAFEVPSEISSAQTGEKVDFMAEITGDQIRISIPVAQFGNGNIWHLILEDVTFGDRFGRIVTEGVLARSSCVIAFDPKTGDGIEIFDPHCRTPIKK